MDKSTHTCFYDAFKVKVIAMRQQAKLTQRQLAQRLGREHSFIGRVELGDRRVDLVEFCWLCLALDQDPGEVFAELLAGFKKLGMQAPKGTTRGKK